MVPLRVRKYSTETGGSHRYNFSSIVCTGHTSSQSICMIISSLLYLTNIWSYSFCITTQIFVSIQSAFADGRPVSLPFPLISKWTGGFNPERVIGEGAFGSVFSGLILFPDEVGGPSGQGRKVAVKKVNGEGIIASLLVALQGRKSK